MLFVLCLSLLDDQYRAVAWKMYVNLRVWDRAVKQKVDRQAGDGEGFWNREKMNDNPFVLLGQSLVCDFSPASYFKEPGLRSKLLCFLEWCRSDEVVKARLYSTLFIEDLCVCLNISGV